jgi:hypothetical protein
MYKAIWLFALSLCASCSVCLLPPAGQAILRVELTVSFDESSQAAFARLSDPQQHDMLMEIWARARERMPQAFDQLGISLVPAPATPRLACETVHSAFEGVWRSFRPAEDDGGGGGPKEPPTGCSWDHVKKELTCHMRWTEPKWPRKIPNPFGGQLNYGHGIHADLMFENFGPRPADLPR